MNKALGRVGTIGRFKPLHHGHAAMLKALCENAAHAIIGLGSTNRYDEKNPFTAKESAEMIHLILKRHFSNYTVIEIPDHDEDESWKNNVLDAYGKLDHFVTENDWVKTLLQKHYPVLHPEKVIPTEFVDIHATKIRQAMLRNEQWTHWVPAEVANYLKQNKLDLRFKNEFGKTI